MDEKKEKMFFEERRQHEDSRVAGACKMHID